MDPFLSLGYMIAGAFPELSLLAGMIFYPVFFAVIAGRRDRERRALRAKGLVPSTR